jgi:ubiquinone/menaquinone biosynthesis C-methylase UbiE
MRPAFQVPKGDYGFDNPSGIFVLGGVVVVFWVLAVVHALLGRWVPAVIEGFLGLFPLATLISYIYSTRRGKFSVWSELIDDLHLRGDEEVLDMGCGRGAVLSMAAKRLDRGHAFGLDLWSSVDQSGNSPEATLRNLEVEGVKEMCKVETGNMMAMPFPDTMFDLVVSSLAIHNIKGQAGRFKALDEALRVLKPGGRLVVVDLLPMAGAYTKHLQERGMKEVEEHPMDWHCWFGLPWVVRLVKANKPK